MTAPTDAQAEAEFRERFEIEARRQGARIDRHPNSGVYMDAGVHDRWCYYIAAARHYSGATEKRERDSVFYGHLDRINLRLPARYRINDGESLADLPDAVGRMMADLRADVARLEHDCAVWKERAEVHSFFPQHEVRKLRDETERLRGERDEAWRHYGAVRRAALCDERTHHDDLVVTVRRHAAQYRAPPTPATLNSARDAVVEAARALSSEPEANRWFSASMSTLKARLAAYDALKAPDDPVREARDMLDSLRAVTNDPKLGVTQLAYTLDGHLRKAIALLDRALSDKEPKK
jgi:hypothetical protein